jgi:hypothetical protein
MRTTPAPTPAPLSIDDFDEDHIWHVYPRFGRAHIIDQKDKCWCMPRVDLDEDGAIVIHEIEH